MVEREQVRPLAPSTEHPHSHEDNTTLHLQPHTKKKFSKRCVYPLVFLLLLATVIVVLIFTIFRVKDPVITMNSFIVTKLDFVNNMTPKPGANMSLIADVSVKNPNVASFRYSNTTTSLYYRGIMIGEARGPPGKAKARRSIRMNITIDVIVDRLISSPDLVTELGSEMVSGLLTMSSFSRVPGQVNILNLFKRHVVVKMNCTTTFNISSQAIQKQTCKQKVKL